MSPPPRRNAARRSENPSVKTVRHRQHTDEVMVPRCREGMKCRRKGRRVSKPEAPRYGIR